MELSSYVQIFNFSKNILLFTITLNIKQSSNTIFNFFLIDVGGVTSSDNFDRGRPVVLIMTNKCCFRRLFYI